MNEQKARRLIDLIIEKVTESTEDVEQRITSLSKKYRVKEVSFDVTECVFVCLFVFHRL